MSIPCVSQKTSLQRDLQSGSSQILFRQLQASNPALMAIANWEQLIETAGSRTTSLAVANSLLQVVLKANTSVPDQFLRSVLILSFWPRLCALDRKIRLWDSNAEDRWQNIFLAFFDSVSNPSLQRASHIGRRAFYDTWGKLWRTYKRTWRQQQFIKSTGFTWASETTGQDDPSLAWVDIRDEFEASRTKLLEFQRNGLLDDFERRLIERIRLDGQPLREVAGELGLTYDAAKCRRDRAERRLAQAGCCISSLQDVCRKRKASCARLAQSQACST